MAVDRQSLIFFIVVFIFLSLPSRNDQPHSHQERETLDTFQKSLKQFRRELNTRDYISGYGNITGFLLSYDDYVSDKSPAEWPLHKYTPEHPWFEDEKYSVLPNAVSDQLKKFWGIDPVPDEDSLGYLLNVSGVATGEFVKPTDQVKEVPLQLPGYLETYFKSITEGAPWDGNSNEGNGGNIPTPDENPKKVGEVKSSSGNVVFKLNSLGYNFQNKQLKKNIEGEQDKIDDAVVVKLQAVVSDHEEIDTNDIELIGVYFQKTGSLVATTNSAKFHGDFALPHLTLSEDKFTKSQKLMGQMVNTTDIDKDISMESMNVFISKSLEQCEFVTFIQLEKTQFSIKELREIDEELANPRGVPIPKTLPKLRVKQSLMYSPDCGMVLNSNPKTAFEGYTHDVITRQSRKLLIGFSVLVACQLYLFMTQIKSLNTPGPLSNISVMTLMFFQYEDSLVTFTFLLISTLFEDLYLILTGITIVTQIMYTVFETGLLVRVCKVQANERGTTWWQILRGSMRSESNGTPSTTDGDTNGTTGETSRVATPDELPLPVTEPTTTTAAADLAAPESSWNPMFAPGFAVAIVSVLVILNATMWRKSYRRAFEVAGLTVLNSFWIPQFLRNTLKNRRIPFSWTFVVGTSVIRLIPIIYVNVFSNPFRHAQNISFVVFLTCWMGLQLALIALQSILGPRFWINDKWLPQAYNYHPLISLKDLEHGFGSDLLANIGIDDLSQEPEASKKDDSVVHCKTDCAICMAEIDLPIYKHEPTKSAKFTGEKAYMVTPCFHVFHTECLEDWMKYKLQCPVCRNGLPPV